MGSYAYMWAFGTGFFHFICFQGSSVMYGTSILWTNNIPLYVYNTVYLSITSDGHLSFQFLAIMSNAAMNMFVQVFVWTYVLIYFGNGLAGSYGNSLFYIQGTAKLFS